MSQSLLGFASSGNRPGAKAQTSQTAPVTEGRDQVAFFRKDAWQPTVKASARAAPGGAFALDVTPKFERHCRAEFRYLSANEPLRMKQLLDSDELSEGLTADAILVVGEFIGDWAIGALVELYGRKNSPLIREAVVRALGRRVRDRYIRHFLEAELAKKDLHWAVREAIEDTLED